MEELTHSFNKHNNALVVVNSLNEEDLQTLTLLLLRKDIKRKNIINAVSYTNFIQDNFVVDDTVELWGYASNLQALELLRILKRKRKDCIVVVENNTNSIVYKQLQKEVGITIHLPSVDLISHSNMEPSII
ncbi:hypothetical protein [Halobacillus litoralis]|uniref:Uncharacterized protein n=1 Tax=Halobacillus litoralis TaxID=45668 RepID=A0A410MJ84_9BACI|nr:hypothetical protein [Halobacillus litoralis]QAS54794.1 hypothetical protein HLI_21300 [Halobacillus litoralis]